HRSTVTAGLPRLPGTLAGLAPLLMTGSAVPKARALPVLSRTLPGELRGAPAEGGHQALPIPYLVELHAHLGLRRVEWREDVEAGTDGVAEAGGVRAAVDGELGGREGLGRDEGEALGNLHGGGHQ